jgi:hypothetical protein
MKVGINEGLNLTKISYNAKEGSNASIDFHFSDGSATATVGVDDDPFAENTENGLVDTGSGGGNSIKVWELEPIKTVNEMLGKTLTADEINKASGDQITELRNLIHSFALCYRSGKDLPTSGDVWTSIGITTKEDYAANKNSASTLKAFCKGLVDKYSEALDGYLSPQDRVAKELPPVTLRVLCVRQSKAKHYPAFRRKYLATQPVVELGSIPIEATKLVFSTYEKSNGLDSGEAIINTSGDKKEDMKTGEDMFK